MKEAFALFTAIALALAPTSAAVTDTSNISPEQAFTVALGALKGRVNLLDIRGVATIRLRQDAAWEIQLANYAEIPEAGLSIAVNSKGTATLRLGNGGDPDQWLAAMKGGKEDTKGKLRPEVALRKALQSLGNWYTGSGALLDKSGRIKLSRPEPGDEWFIDVFGYSGMRLEGFYITVKDDGKVVVKPAT